MSEVRSWVEEMKASAVVVHTNEILADPPADFLRATCWGDHRVTREQVAAAASVLGYLFAGLRAGLENPSTTSRRAQCWSSSGARSTCLSVWCTPLLAASSIWISNNGGDDECDAGSRGDDASLTPEARRARGTVGGSHRHHQGVTSLRPFAETMPAALCSYAVEDLKEARMAIAHQINGPEFTIGMAKLERGHQALLDCVTGFEEADEIRTEQLQRLGEACDVLHNISYELLGGK